MKKLTEEKPEIAKGLLEQVQFREKILKLAEYISSVNGHERKNVALKEVL